MHGFRLAKMLQLAESNILSLTALEPLVQKELNNFVLADGFQIRVDSVAVNQLLCITNPNLFCNLSKLKQFQFIIQRFFNPKINIVLFDFETIC